MLGGLCSQYPNSACLLINVKSYAWDVFQGALVVLCFKPEVPFDKDEDPAGFSARVGTDPSNVS